MGVEGDDGPLPPGEPANEVFHHVGKLVGQAVLYRGGQVEDHLAVRRGVEVVQHRRTDIHGIVHLRPHKRLRGVFIAKIHTACDHRLGHLIDQVCRVGGNFGDTLTVHMEYHLALEGGGGIIEVQDDVFGPRNGLKGFFDEVLPGLDQHLDGHVVRDVAPLYKLPADLVLRLAGGGEANLDLLHPDVHQGVKILQLFLQIHGVDEGLVPVPQVHRAPHRGAGDGPVRPGAVFNGLWDKGDVLLKSGLQIHGFSSFGIAGDKKTPPTN